MAQQTRIEWTEATWNPVTGCTPVSEGCRHCYARRFALRLRATGNPRYRNGFEVTLHPDLLDLPKRWKKPRMVFVNSMSDLFHQDVPDEFIRQVFSVMEQCPQHVFQVLTKRSARLAAIGDRLPWLPNVWVGVTVENQDALGRIDDLLQVSPAVRFVSCEPLLGPLDNLPLAGIHWVIVGGETGPGARPMRPEWVRSILKQCRKANVPFFFKRWGGGRKDCLIDGEAYREMPREAP